MGKSNAVLATLALIIGLGAAGFIVYDNFIAIPPSPPKENQWYDSHPSSWYMAGSEAWSTMANIYIDFNVSTGQNVYFSLISVINFDDSSDPTSYVEIHFVVDGIRWTQPRIYVWRYSIDEPNGLRMSASLQHYNTTMIAGNHNVTLAYRGDSTSDFILDSSLFVQTFN